MRSRHAVPDDGQRVVQVVQHLVAGGIETMALDLMAQPEIGGHVISLTGRTDDLVAAWPALRAVRHRVIGLDQAHASHLVLQTRFVRLLRRLDPRAVIVHHIGPLLHGGLAARLARVPRLVHIEHDAWHYAENPMHRRIAAVCERMLRPDRVAVSDEIAARVRAMLPASPVVVIPPGIDTNRFRPVARSGARAALGFRDDWQVIGTLGRLVEVKGQRYLIEALATLPATTHVALIGDGPERMALERLAREAGVASRVHFLGLRSDPENILPAFDVFCLPSLNEGLPRAVLEAQACGIPVVASDVGALRQAIADGGRVVPPKDTSALAAALAELLAAPPPVPATRGHIVDRFSLHATVAALRPLVARPS